jgi:hypothetical protein
VTAEWHAHPRSPLPRALAGLALDDALASHFAYLRDRVPVTHAAVLAILDAPGVPHARRSPASLYRLAGGRP